MKPLCDFFPWDNQIQESGVNGEGLGNERE